MSKLKDKWAIEFNNLMHLSEDDIQTWTVNYVNLNNNIFVIISEDCDEVIII